MKMKIVVLVALCAVITLSFTFSSAKKVENKVTQQSSSTDSEPVGGFTSEDKF